MNLLPSGAICSFEQGINLFAEPLDRWANAAKAVAGSPASLKNLQPSPFELPSWDVGATCAFNEVFLTSTAFALMIQVFR